MQVLTDNVAEIQLSYRPTARCGPIITTSKDAYDELRNWFPDDTISLQERFVVLYLNRANRVLGVYHASSGGLTGTIADPRLIMTVALKTAAAGIILAHNHPSANMRPSIADKDLTQRLVAGARLLDLNVLDHIIVSPAHGEYFSFADEGLL